MQQKAEATGMDAVRLTAAKQGKPQYKNKPCAACGHEWRYTSSGICVQCQKRHSAAYREKLRSALREARGGA